MELVFKYESYGCGWPGYNKSVTFPGGEVLGGHISWPNTHGVERRGKLFHASVEKLEVIFERLEKEEAPREHRYCGAWIKEWRKEVTERELALLMKD